MNRLFLLLLGLTVVLPTGCRTKENESNTETTEVADAGDQPAADQPDSWDRVTELFDKAKESGQTTAESTSDWIAELYGQTRDASGKAADDANEWIQKMYEQAKNRGETSASNAKEWVSEDLGKMGAWEYKTFAMSASDLAATEKKLNEMGDQRWECFLIQHHEDTYTMFFKRQQRSYLRQVPAKDLIRLLPLMGLGGGGDEPNGG